jgi:tripartite-type tricarboxylate transporter receptor subunit TctC
MLRLLAKSLLTATALASLCLPAAAQSVADFYKGKTVNVIVGFGPGGGYDLYARTLARHLGQHIPGNPTVVVQNMEGAGSVRAANYVYGVAPKDGTTIAAVNQNAPMYQMLGGAGATYDAEKLQYLGSIANSNGLVYTWAASGIKTIDDARAREVPLGAVGRSSDSYIYPTIVNVLTGTKFKPIPGYAGTGQINIAIERGEVVGRGGNTWASVQSSNKSWLEQHKLNFLVQIGFKKEAELPDVPMLQELVKNDADRKVADVVSLPTALGYSHWLAPGVPKDRLEALRAAYAATLKDPKFLAEAAKANLEVRPQTGAEVAALANKVATTPQDIRVRTAKLLGWQK